MPPPGPIRKTAARAATALSLLLALATTVFWIRGLHTGDGLEFDRHDYDLPAHRHLARWTQLYSGRGGFVLAWAGFDAQFRSDQGLLRDNPSPRPVTYRTWRTCTPPDDYLARSPDRSRIVDRWGFQLTIETGRLESYYSRGTTTAPADADLRRVFHRRIVALPCWALLLATTTWPAYHLSRLLQHRRQRHHAANPACPHCGYDLRATPHRCPECGAIPARPAPDARRTIVSDATPGPAKVPPRSDARP